jgi:hypothetical protein
MGNGSGRRKLLLLVVTHTLAVAAPVLLLGPVARDMARRAPAFKASTAEEYSERVAGIEVAVGDDRAAVAGLRRHVDRLAVIRKQLVAGGGEALDLWLLDLRVCAALAEIAFLSGAEERDARIADAAASCQRRLANCPGTDAHRVLDHGAHWVGTERGSE